MPITFRAVTVEAIDIAMNLAAVSALLAAIGIFAGYVEAGTMGPV